MSSLRALLAAFRNGEVSRAMRNRGIELFMLSDSYQLAPQSSDRQLTPAPQTQGLLQQAVPEGQVQEPWELAVRELEALLAAVGVPGWQGPACLAAAHLSLVQHAAQAHRSADMAFSMHSNGLNSWYHLQHKPPIGWQHVQQHVLLLGSAPQ